MLNGQKKLKLSQWGWMLLCMMALGGFVVSDVSLSLVQADEAKIMTVDLRPKWQVGQVTRYQVNETQVITQTYAGPTGERAKSLVVDTKMKVRWEVKEAHPNGGGVVVVTAESQEGTLAIDGQAPVSMAESDHPMAKMQAAFDEASLEVPLTVHVTSSGQIEKIEGLSTLIDTAATKSDSPDSMQEHAESIKKSVRHSIKRLTGFLEVSQETVRVDEDWRSEDQRELFMGELSSVRTSRVKRVEQVEAVPIATIQTTGQFEFVPTPFEDKLPEGFSPPEVELTKQNYRSEALFDLSRHELVGRFGTEEVEVTSKIVFPGGQAMTTTYHIKTATEMIRLSEK